jgi:outer membrane protein OmpA-like peptidoglycan-associated protein
MEALFNRCVGQLYERNFDDVRLSSIHFEPDNEFASIRQEETAFTRMLEYLKVDNAVSEIVVTGHADNTGLACYNEGLSERRAWYVYDLLVARGIDTSLLRVSYAGESEPVSKGSSNKSRAANRRVTVELRR